jgi:hypothetical protein
MIMTVDPFLIGAQRQPLLMRHQDRTNVFVKEGKMNRQRVVNALRLVSGSNVCQV